MNSSAHLEYVLDKYLIKLIPWFALYSGVPFLGFRFFHGRNVQQRGGRLGTRQETCGGWVRPRTQRRGPGRGEQRGRRQGYGRLNHGGGRRRGHGRGRGRLSKEPNVAENQVNHERQLVVRIYMLYIYQLNVSII